MDSSVGLGDLVGTRPNDAASPGSLPRTKYPSSSSWRPADEHLAERKSSSSSSSRHLKNFVCGAIAGCTGCCYSYPLDTIKVHAQTVRLDNGVKHISYRKIVSRIVAKDGVRGFYKGIAAPMAGVACDNAAIFAAHNATLQWFDKQRRQPPPALSRDHSDAVVHPSPMPQHEIPEYDRPIAQLVIAGLLSGAVSALVLTPFELVKCRIQLARMLEEAAGSGRDGGSTNVAPRRPLVVALRVLAQEGPAGLFSGLPASAFREVPGTAGWLLTYQTILRNWHYRHYRNANEAAPPPEVHKSLVAGGLAGCAYWTIAFPGDVIKTRRQSALAEYRHMSLWTMFTTVLKTEGIRGIYRGYGITLVRAFPGNGIIFTTYELTSAKWDALSATKATSASS